MAGRPVNYIKEFVAMAMSGAIISALITSFRPEGVSPIAYVFICSALVGTYSITIKGPHPAIMLFSPVALWIGQSQRLEHPKFGAVASVLGFSLMAYVVSELVHFMVRLRRDPGYRERWNNRPRPPTIKIGEALKAQASEARRRNLGKLDQRYQRKYERRERE